VATSRAVYDSGATTAMKPMKQIVWVGMDADSNPDSVSRMVSVLSVSLGEGRSHL